MSCSHFLLVKVTFYMYFIKNTSQREKNPLRGKNNNLVRHVTSLNFGKDILFLHTKIKDSLKCFEIPYLDSQRCLQNLVLDLA